MVFLTTSGREAAHPLDQFESVAEGRDWQFERAADDEIMLSVRCQWGDLVASISWRDDVEGLQIACGFDLRVPQRRQVEVFRLLNLINEQIYFGHFDLWREDGSLLYRNTLMLAGGAEATRAQCNALIEGAVAACNQYYPAFQFVIWAGRTAEEAMAASLFETVGEA